MSGPIDKIERLVALSKDFGEAKGAEEQYYIAEKMNALAEDLNPEEEYLLMVALLCEHSGRSREETDEIIREEFGDDVRTRIAAVADLIHEVENMVEILEMDEEDEPAPDQPRLLN